MEGVTHTEGSDENDSDSDDGHHLEDAVLRQVVPVIGLGESLSDGRHGRQVAAHLDKETQEQETSGRNQEQRQRL